MTSTSSSSALGFPAPDAALNSAIGTRHAARPNLATEIQNMIITSGLRQGDPLPPEPALCKMLGASRTSVREAIRVLTALDIVEIKRGKGTYVGSGSLSPLVSSLVFRGMLSNDHGKTALTEILDVRITIDLGTAEAICAVMKGKRDPYLEKLVDEMKDLSAKHKSYPSQDREFHLALQRKIDSTLMTQLVIAFWDVHSILRPHLAYDEVYTVNQTVALAHEEILNAATEGDPQQYRDAIQRHYVPIRESLKKIP